MPATRKAASGKATAHAPQTRLSAAAAQSEIDIQAEGGRFMYEVFDAVVHPASLFIFSHSSETINWRCEPTSPRRCSLRGNRDRLGAAGRQFSAQKGTKQRTRTGAARRGPNRRATAGLRTQPAPGSEG